MTIDEAIKELINSEPFKQKARHEDKLRVSLGRINKNNAGLSLKIELLQSFGYTVIVKGPGKKSVTK